MEKYEQTDWAAEAMETDEIDPVADLVLHAPDAYARTLAELARSLGMQPLAVTQWRGGKRTPSPATLRRMAREFVHQSDELRRWAVQLNQVADAQAERIEQRARERQSRRPRQDATQTRPSAAMGEFDLFDHASYARDRKPL